MGNTITFDHQEFISTYNSTVAKWGVPKVETSKRIIYTPMFEGKL
jgi:hypothetical protein